MLLFLSAEQADAQAVANATIHGAVNDPSGAVIPGAMVRAVQTDTGQTQSTVTGSDGSYVLPNLPVGPYKLEVNSPSFSTYTQSGILLQVGNNIQVNVVLQVGAVTQDVKVTAAAAMVETEDTSVSQVIDQRRIIDLPLNGRQVTDLILLSGGSDVPPNAASRVVTTHDYATAVGVSISGGQENGNNYLLDGGDNNDSHSNVNLPFPFPDALQEFNVQTNGVSARYGLHPGAVVNVVTKSGTNQIHGDLFEFVRNGDFNARNFFAPAQDTLRRNQFGGTVGGPVIKDKIFLFSGYQGTRTRTAPPQSVSYVPTQAALNGDFSVLDSAACQSNNKPVTLIDPASNTPFPNNFISPSRFSAPAVTLAKLIPVATNPCGKITYSIPNPNNENQYVGRGDWVQSSRHSVYGRYFIADFDNPPYYTDNILTTTRSGLEERSQSVTLGDQFSITPTMVNSFHATFARLSINRAVSQQLPNPVSLGVNMFNFYPHFMDLSVSSRFSIGGGSNAPSVFDRNQFQYADDIDIIRGRHHMMFGFEMLALQMDEVNISLGNGEWTFNGSLSGDPLADYLIGRPSLLTNGNPVQIGLRQKYYGAYAQDDIQVRKGLNVHVGVRWEPSVPEHDVAGRGSHFSMPAFLAGQKSAVYNNAPIGLLFHGDPGIPAAYADTNWLGFAPRIGLAWDPKGDGKQSLRSSYGIFFDAPESYTNRDFALSSPWGDSVSLTAPAGGFANPYAGYPGGNPFPTPYPPAKDAPFSLSGLYVNLPLNLHHMYMQQWDLSYQRQIAKDWMVSATYIGNKSTHLRSSYEANPAVYMPGKSTVANTSSRRLLTVLNPAAGAYYATITTVDDGLNTNYNALRLNLEHRFGNNFTWLMVYTWSHCLQNAEPLANRNSQGANYYQNPYNRNADYGPCDFDIRHNFNNSFVYSSPKFTRRAIDLLAGNWQLGFLITVRSGFPFNPVTGVDNSLTGVGQDRPNVVGAPYVRNTSNLVWINASAFTPNALGTFGNAGYNSLIGPGLFDLDANLTRLFKVTEHQRAELRFEFFNVLNHVNFSNPVGSLKSSAFGLIQSAGDPRILQLAAKYTF
jgi:hypothetical protein